jgi:hypothetical protein
MSQIIRERSAPLQRFTGGLNNYWDQSSIDDSELASVINFEFTSNGALTSRPPIYLEKDDEDEVIVTPAESEPFDIIGTYIEQGGDRYLVAVTDDKTWIYNVGTQLWTEIADFRASDCTQYLNKIVLCSETQAGGYWEDDVFTETPTMPYLGGIELFQTRFFGFGVQGTPTANIVYWSNISTAGPSGESTSVWDWEDEFDAKLYVEIGGGDGQWITAMAQGYNDIVIFRNRSTYRYSYGELPEEGTMQVMQQDIGAETRRSVVKFENAHLVLSGQTLYLYQNYLYYPLNSEKVRFKPDNSYERRFEHAISVVGSRCIVFHNGSIYSYDMESRTWSQWTSSSRIGYFVTVPRRYEDDSEELYFGISGSAELDAPGVTDYSIYRIEDEPTSSVGSEEMTCSLRTKIYDFQTPVEWKRLYFWTADITTARIVRAVAVPVAIREEPLAVHWDELSSDGQYDNSFYTWDELSQEDEFDDRFGTWDRLKTPGTIETVIEDFPQGQLIRMETKLDNSLRFRRIFFELYLSCDGTAATSPVQVFSIIPMVGAKAKIAREAN